jgi:hypothetical protein
VEGNLAGAGDALMLDCDGFVSETNATNIVSVYLDALSLFYAFKFSTFVGLMLWSINLIMSNFIG